MCHPWCPLRRCDKFPSCIIFLAPHYGPAGSEDQRVRDRQPWTVRKSQQRLQSGNPRAGDDVATLATTLLHRASCHPSGLSLVTDPQLARFQLLRTWTLGACCCFLPLLLALCKARNFLRQPGLATGWRQGRMGESSTRRVRWRLPPVPGSLPSFIYRSRWLAKSGMQHSQFQVCVLGATALVGRVHPPMQITSGCDTTIATTSQWRRCLSASSCKYMALTVTSGQPVSTYLNR